MAYTIKKLYEGTLASTSPDLILQKYRSGNAQMLTWMSTRGPMVDKDLRRAMMIGTDLEAIVKTIYTEGDIQCAPWNPGVGADIWTPIEDLPPSARELFTYDLLKAKQMIIDAGYPEGLKISLDYSATRGESAEIAPLLQDMWAKINVELILQPREHAVLLGMGSAGEFEHARMSSGGASQTVARLDSFRTQPWLLFYDDEYFNDLIDKAAAEIDVVDRNAMIKELGIYCIDATRVIPMGNPYLLCAWWPWVKNYYGEIEGGYDNYSAMVSTLWIDQALKAEMGY